MHYKIINKIKTIYLLKSNKERDCTIDCVKGIGIILVVIGHSGCPNFLYSLIYCFHMPLFFIASGWFFSEKNLSNIKDYIVKKVKNLYVPFLKWSLSFLVLHNVFCYLYLTQQPTFDICDFGFHFINIVSRMSGYEVELLGTFWFFRALLIGNVLFICSVFFIRKIFGNYINSVKAVVVIYLGICGILCYSNINIPFYPQGGYRDMMAVMFIGVGVLLKHFVPLINNQLTTLIVMFLILSIVSFYSPTELYQNATILQWLTISFSGIVGFIFILLLSISMRDTMFKKFLVRIGNHTFIIYALHFTAFKIVSLIKVIYYGLPLPIVGQHPIVSNNNIIWWPIYSIIGLFVPLLVDLFSSMICNYKKQES